MRVTFREIKNEAVRTLREIRQQHTQALLMDEEIKIRIFLSNLIKTQTTEISPKCKIYWQEGLVTDRMRLSDDQRTLLPRNDVTEKIRKMVDYLLRLRFNERQKTAIMKTLGNEIRLCITELMRSKRKRREEREAARAVTQSSVDIPPFDDVDMTREVEDSSTRTTSDQKTPYRNASGRHRRRSARMH